MRDSIGACVWRSRRLSRWTARVLESRGIAAGKRVLNRFGGSRLHHPAQPIQQGKQLFTAETPRRGETKENTDLDEAEGSSSSARWTERKQRSRSIRVPDSARKPPLPQFGSAPGVRPAPVRRFPIGLPLPPAPPGPPFPIGSPLPPAPPGRRFPSGRHFRLRWPVRRFPVDTRYPSPVKI
jgi:hypothetical protein